MSSDIEARGYVILAKQGDEMAYRWLLKKYQRFIYRQAHKHSHGNKEKFDEFYSAGLYGFFKGIRGFDLTKDVNVLTFVSRCVDNEMNGMWRNSRTMKRSGVTISLHETFGGEDGDDSIEIIDTISADNQPVDHRLMQNEQARQVYCLMQEYKKGRYTNMLFDAICGDETQMEVGQKYGVQQSQVSRVVKSFAQWARKKMVV